MKWTLDARTDPSAPALVVDERSGSVRVRDPRVFHAHNRAFCRHWAEVAGRASMVIEARVDLPSATCHVDFRPGTIDREGMARSFADSIYDALTAPPALAGNGNIPTSWQVLRASPTGVQALAPASNRTMDYALAAGSLAMTGVALVVPGLPTIPFLVASSYYLARVSPRLDEALRAAPFLGPILRELEEHKALSRKSKRNLMGFVVVVIAITLATTAPSLLLAILMAISASVSLYSIGRMPEIGDETPAYPAFVPTA